MISETNKKRRILYPVAFLLPLLIATTACICMGITPFGDRAWIKWDLEIQYIDYFGYIRRRSSRGSSVAGNRQPQD